MALPGSAPDLLDARELETKVVGPASTAFRTLIDEPGYQLHRFSPTSGRFDVDGLRFHVLSLQHATGAPRVKARVGGNRFSSLWERGTFNLVPAGAPLTIAWDQSIDVTGVWLTPGFCARLLESSNFDVAPRFAAQNPTVSEIVTLLSRSAEAGEPYGRLYREGLLVSLVACLGHLNPPVKQTRRRHGLAPSRLRRVLDYIETHLADDIPLAALAAEAGVSERHFCTMFGLAVGKSPHRYLVERRIEQSKARLRASPSMTVTEVALSVGFKSSAHFATMFRKSVGTTPSDFRRDL